MTWPRDVEPVPLAGVGVRGDAVATITDGEPWRPIHRALFGIGWVFVVLDDGQKPVRAFRKCGSNRPEGN